MTIETTVISQLNFYKGKNTQHEAELGPRFMNDQFKD